MSPDKAPQFLAGRATRAQLFLQTAADAAATWYDPSGAWVRDETPSSSRDRFWISFSLYNGSAAQHRLADAVVLATEVESFPDGHRFNIFDSNIAAMLVADFSDRMSPAARDFLLAITAEGHHPYPGDRQADYQFHGYNDNMPSKGTMSLILGGELVGSAEALAHGRFQLRQFAEELHRGGFAAEYTSPTYLPLTLHSFAAIAQLAGDPADRALALAVERRLWADIACHWHPQSRQIAGPHSRAYTTDSVGHLSNIRTLVWTVLGEEVTGLSPMTLFEPLERAVYHHSGNLPFNIGQMAYFVSGHYHLDLDLAELFLEKPTPFVVRGTSEQGDTALPSRRTLCTAHLTPDYSLASSTTGYGDNGQSHNFLVTYPREGQEPVGGMIYCRMILNDDCPGLPESDGHWVSEANLVRNYSNSFVLQDGPVCLYSCHPHLSLAGKDVSRLRHGVILPTHFGDVEELRVGEQEVGDWSGEFGLQQWVGIRAGRCLLAFRPLCYSALDLETRLVLESYDRYKLVSAENYRGPARQFAEDELRSIFNGFVAEVASVDDFPSLAAFLAALQPAEIEDYALFRTRRLRYFRPALPQRTAVELETSYTVAVCSPRYAAINGAEVEMVPWEATGLPAEAVSLFPQGRDPRPTGIPWEQLGVLWYQEDRWAINESGR